MATVHDASETVQAVEKILNADNIKNVDKDAVSVGETAVTLPSGVTAQTINVETKMINKASAEKTAIVPNKDQNQVVSEATCSNGIDQILMTPSEMHKYYQDEGFGKANIAIKNMEQNTYHVNKRPLAIDQSPLKEIPPDFDDVQPITAYRKNLGHENAYIYSFVLPEGVRGTDFSLRNDCPYGMATAWSIPALTVLKENLLGLPIQGAEWPLISSANPTTSNSYLHSVQHRVAKTGILDLRFKMSASRNGKTKEMYILGRVWTPLDTTGIIWENAPDNYDAASPMLYPAFADIGKITLDTKKELTNVMHTLRFVDRNFSPDVEQSIISILETLGRNKLSLSRLYWRIWCCIAEATLMESQNKRWHVERIHNSFTPMTLNGPLVLREIFSQAQMAVQPFFITHSMLESIGGDNITALLLFLLCDNFEAKCHFGISKCWPPLGDVRAILPADHKALYNLPTRMAIQSENLYSLLSYFARVLGQQHLIDEIGKTVSMFLLRPEGDHTWLAHNFISIRLPLFRCKRSLHFAWSNADTKLTYPFKTPPYYKLAWIGSVRYMQVALAANTVLSELGVFSALQLENNGFEMSREWCREMLSNFRRDQGSCLFNSRLQFVGLRCDWGCLLNRITSSIIINRPMLCNFMRIIQWQEWLLFQRIQPESTWMAGQMGHIKPKTVLKPLHSYNPSLSGIESGLGDVYYRLLTENSSKLMLHVESFSIGRMVVREAASLSSLTGFPLDGQFRHIKVGNDINSYYHFVPRDEVDCSIIMGGWHRRISFHWQLHCPQQFLHSTMGLRDGDVYLESKAMPPTIDCNTGFFNTKGIVRKLCTLEDSYSTRKYGIALYGTPTLLQVQEESDVTSTSRDESVEEEWSHGVPYDVMHNQVYPIHYCDSKYKPTAAELMLKYGIKLESSTAGVSLFDSIEMYSMAAKAEFLHGAIQYTSPDYARQANIGDGGTLAGRGAAGTNKNLETTFSIDHSTKGCEKIDNKLCKMLKKREKKAAERKAALREAENLARERAVTKIPQTVMNTSVNVSRIKNELRAFAKNNELDLVWLEMDPGWKSWDGMENLNAATTASRESLEERYSNILRSYNVRDLTQMMRLTPRIARVELCRTLLQLMEECVQYLGPGRRDIHIHDKLKTFLTTAIANLNQCNIMSEAELHSFYGCKHLKFDDWQIYGTLTPEAFWEVTLSWSEFVHNCPLWGEHDPQFGPTIEEEGRYMDKHGTSEVEVKVDKVLTEKELSDKISDVVDSIIKETDTIGDQGFRLAKECCSAQSPKSSVYSPVANCSDNKLAHCPPKEDAQTPIGSHVIIQNENTVQTQKLRIGVDTHQLPDIQQTTKKKSSKKEKKKLTKSEKAMQDIFSTALPIASYLTSENTHIQDVTDVGRLSLPATFEKMQE